MLDAISDSGRADSPVIVTSLVPTFHCMVLPFKSMARFHLSNHDLPRMASYFGNLNTENQEIQHAPQR